MAYTTTGASSLGGSKGGAGLVQTAYDRMVEFELRDEPLIRAVADKRPAKQSMPGDSVVLQRYVDLSQATTPLSEESDITAPAVATPTSTTITLQEFGNAAIVTRKLQLFSLTDVDPDIATLLANNMADSIDSVAMTTLRGGSNVVYAGNASSTGSVDKADLVDSADIRKVVAKLRGNKAAPRKQSLYWCGIHPDVSHDLRAESGAGGWRLPHEYSQVSNIWAGEIGNYEGAYFVESARLYNAFDGTTETAGAPSGITISAGVATVSQSAHGYAVGDYVQISGATPAGLNAIQLVTSVATNTWTFATSVTGTVTGTLAAARRNKNYRTIVAGKQALAEAVAEEPHTVIGPVTDTLKRFRPIGWYGVLGFARYREEALFRIESGSSIQ